MSLLVNAVSRLGLALRDTFRTLSRTKPETLGPQEGNGTSAKKAESDQIDRNSKHVFV